MKYSDLIGNRAIVDKILKYRAKCGHSLVSRDNTWNRSIWFELNLEKVTSIGEVELIFHYEQDSDIIAKINLDSRELTVLGSEKFEISTGATESILSNCIKEVVRMGSH